jgi:hypothetical protein
MTHQLTTARQRIVAMTDQQIATLYFSTEYGDTVSAEMVDEVVAELSAEELAAIVGSVYDQPHLIDR